MQVKATVFFPIIATLIATSAQAYEAGDIIIRAGTAMVAPNSSSDYIVSSIAGETNGKASANNDTQLGLSASYMFTENFGLELLAASPFSHDLEGKGSVPLVGSIEGMDLGSIKHLPPNTFSAVFLFRQIKHVSTLYRFGH